MLLLIYGREQAKKEVASKTALMLFSSNAKIKQVFKEIDQASHLKFF